ncbi:hypothetical protein NOGI109294_26195 [Nocardiopsis gilva]
MFRALFRSAVNTVNVSCGGANHTLVRAVARTVGEGNTMSPEPAMPVPAPLDPQTGPSGDYEDLVDDELLVEDVSIDGMCGVY